MKQFFLDIRSSELSSGQMLLISEPVKLKVETVLFYAERNRDIFQSLDTSFFVNQINTFRNYQWDTTIIEDKYSRSKHCRNYIQKQQRWKRLGEI